MIKFYLCLFIRFETQQAADLLRSHVYNSCANKVVRIRIDTIEKLHPEALQLGANLS